MTFKFNIIFGNQSFLCGVSGRDMHVVAYKRPLTELCALLAIRISIESAVEVSQNLLGQLLGRHDCSAYTKNVMRRRMNKNVQN
jgi:hypothetical protein